MKLGYYADVVTRIHQRKPKRLFIKEWQEHYGLSADTMAGRLGIERESYYRLLREQHRITIPRLEQMAEAIGHDLRPQDFYMPPDQPSVDAMLDRADAALRETAVDIVRRLVGRAS